MSFWTFIFLCVVVGIVYDLAKKDKLHQLGEFGGFCSRRKRQGRYDGAPPVVTGREQELERELADLRERIKVLERIATEDHDTKRLSAEIEALRER